MGCPHPIKVRAGPHVPPAQRRPGVSPPASVPSRLKIIVIVILTLCRHLILSPPFHPGATPSAPSTHHSRARLLWWTGSRCDSVCLRSRHFVAWHRPGFAHAFPPETMAAFRGLRHRLLLPSMGRRTKDEGWLYPALPVSTVCPQNPENPRNNTFYVSGPSFISPVHSCLFVVKTPAPFSLPHQSRLC